MKLLFGFALLTLILQQSQPTVPDRSGLEIVEFTFKQEIVKDERFAPRMVSNEPPVLNPDPNLMRVDRNEHPTRTKREEKERLAKMSTVGGVAHTNTPPRPLPVDRNVYVFRATMRNDNSRPITKFVWAYQPKVEHVDDIEYLCNVQLKPGESKEVEVISPIPRQTVIDASASGTEPPPITPDLHHMIINQVQFADSTTWQRPDWNKSVLFTRSGIRKLGKGKCMAL